MWKKIADEKPEFGELVLFKIKHQNYNLGEPYYIVGFFNKIINDIFGECYEIELKIADPDSFSGNNYIMKIPNKCFIKWIYLQDLEEDLVD